MMAYLAEVLHWALILAGAWIGIGSVLCLGLARWFRMNAERDPELCERKSLEFLADAHAKRGEG